MLRVDGSMGEGQHHTLRTALALALATGRGVHIENLRPEGTPPGLLRPHLSLIEAAARVSQARVEGATLGSTAITFEPGDVLPGEHHFAVGLAAPLTDLFHVIVPPLLVADAPSTLIIEGATHAPDAPTVETLTRAWAPRINALGPKVAITVERPGFYPAAGGRLRVEITPADRLAPLHLVERGALQSKRAVACVAHLDEHIARRELETISGMMTFSEAELHLEQAGASRGPGNMVFIELTCEHTTEIFDGVGERTIPAEKVAEGVASEAREYLAAEVPAGRRLARDLLIPLALAGQGAITTLAPDRQLQADVALVQTFFEVELAVANLRGRWQIEL